MRRNITENIEVTKDIIDPLFRMVTGSLTGKTWHSNPAYAFEELGKVIGNNVEKTFDGFVKGIKNLFKGDGIFSKIGKGILGIITEVYKWLNTIISKIPGATEKIPGVGMNISTVVACGLVSALTLIAFYKIFKGILGSSEDDSKYDRYSESINEGNKLVVDFYNLTEHMVYQQKYKTLTEGIFGGIFEFMGKIIKKAFRFVGEIIRDVYRGAKKHPILAFFVLVLCFFVCFCMKNPVMSNIRALFYMKPVETPGLFGRAKDAVISGADKLAHPFVKGIDKFQTIRKDPVGFAKSLVGLSEDADMDIYIYDLFNKI